MSLSWPRACLRRKLVVASNDSVPCIPGGKTVHGHAVAAPSPKALISIPEMPPGHRADISPVHHLEAAPIPWETAPDVLPVSKTGHPAKAITPRSPGVRITRPARLEAPYSSRDTGRRRQSPSPLCSSKYPVSTSCSTQTMGQARAHHDGPDEPLLLQINALRKDAAHDTEARPGNGSSPFQTAPGMSPFSASPIPWPLDQADPPSKALPPGIVLDLAHILIGRKKHHIISRPALADDPDIVRHLPVF